jgi:hypothetical protein
LKFSETSAFKRIETLSLIPCPLSVLQDSDRAYPLTEFMENVILALSRAENLKQLYVRNCFNRGFLQEEGPVPFLLCLLS